MLIKLRDYGRNQKKRKEYIHQSGILLAGVDVSKEKHDACIGALEGVSAGSDPGTQETGLNVLKSPLERICSETPSTLSTNKHNVPVFPIIVSAFCASLNPVVPLVNLYFSNSDSTWRNYCKISQYFIFMIDNGRGNYICL